MPSAHIMTLGEKIRHFRTLKGLTQENMAEELHVSRTAYGEIERDCSNISFSRLEDIAKVLGVPLWLLLSLGDRGYTYFNGNHQTYIVDSQIGKEQTLLYDNKDLVHEVEKLKLTVEAMQKELQLKNEIIDYYKSKQ